MCVRHPRTTISFLRHRRIIGIISLLLLLFPPPREFCTGIYRPRAITRRRWFFGAKKTDSPPPSWQPNNKLCTTYICRAHVQQPCLARYKGPWKLVFVRAYGRRVFVGISLFSLVPPTIRECVLNRNENTCSRHNITVYNDNNKPPTGMFSYIVYDRRFPWHSEEHQNRVYYIRSYKISHCAPHCPLRDQG